jgi:DNA-directed RNA polymerase specialized sigma subunit
MIDGVLRHHFRDTGLIKRPGGREAFTRRSRRSPTKLTGELGRPPLVKEIASEVNVPGRASSR